MSDSNGYVPPKKNPFYSKRLWAAISGVIVVFMGEMGVSEVDPETIQGVVFMIVALILGDSFREVGVKGDAANTEIESLREEIRGIKRLLTKE